MERSMRPLAFVLGLAFLAPSITAASAPSEDQISFAADSTDAHDAEGFVLLHGDVQIRRSDITLTAPDVRMTFTQRLTSSEQLQVDHVSASGRVRVRKGDSSAVGDFAIYDVRRSLVTMIGNVSLSQRSGAVSGARLVWDLESGRALLDGDPSAGPSGRVVGHYVAPPR
jgi:lipopolysaccharide export system protein LptA